MEYHPGRSDITQSKDAKVVVSPKRTSDAGAMPCELAVSPRSFVVSCFTLFAKSLRVSRNQMRKYAMARPKKNPRFRNGLFDAISSP